MILAICPPLALGCLFCFPLKFLHCSLTRDLNGLLHDTSSGCSNRLHQGGINTKFVTTECNTCFVFCWLVDWPAIQNTQTPDIISFGSPYSGNPVFKLICHSAPLCYCNFYIRGNSDFSPNFRRNPSWMPLQNVKCWHLVCICIVCPFS